MKFVFSSEILYRLKIIFLNGDFMWFHEADSGFDVVVLRAHDVTSWIFFSDSDVTRCLLISSSFFLVLLFSCLDTSVFSGFWLAAATENWLPDLFILPWHKTETVEQVRGGKM